MITLRSSFGSRGSSRTLRSSTRRVLVGLEPLDLVARHRAHLLVGVLGVAQLARAGELGARRLEPPERLDDRLEAGQLLAEPADRARVGGDLGRASSAWSVVVLAGDLRELGVELAHDPGGGSVGGSPGGRAGGRPRLDGRVARLRGQLERLALERVEPAGTGSPSATSASSIDTIATSIMSSVGCLVVIIWTRIPGYMIDRTSGLPRCWRRTAGSRSRPPR